MQSLPGRRWSVTNLTIIMAFSLPRAVSGLSKEVERRMELKLYQKILVKKNKKKQKRIR